MRHSFLRMTWSRENKGSSSLRQRNVEYFFGTLLNSYKFHAQLIHLNIISTKHIIYNIMINHLTGFLNKCVLACKRGNHLETASSVKQKTSRPLALVFSVSQMTSFSVIIPYKKTGSWQPDQIIPWLVTFLWHWPLCSWTQSLFGVFLKQGL